jgi:transposase
MRLYGGIDLHSNNNLICLLDERDRVVFERRLPNRLESVLLKLSPYRTALQAVAVESTFNWYWLVDGLMAEGYDVRLVNTAAVRQYEGLKHTDDAHDARWLAHLLRLGVLPEGYIYPRAERGVRDLLRKRSQLVRKRTAHLLSIQNLFARNTGSALSGYQVKQLSEAQVDRLFPEADLALAAKCNLRVLRCLEEEITRLEQVVKARVHLKPAFRSLLSVVGVGPILGLTIMLETGDIDRFTSPGRFASYCRCVGSTRWSNGKKKGEGNRKNGNKYLAWAFVEAAHFAVRYNPLVRRFYQRKKARTHGVVALKAVARKLARASYYVMRDQVPFDTLKAFGPGLGRGRELAMGLAQNHEA